MKRFGARLTQRGAWQFPKLFKEFPQKAAFQRFHLLHGGGLQLWGCLVIRGGARHRSGGWVGTVLASAAMPLRGCERVSMNNSIERCACCDRALATHTHTHVHAGAGALPSTRQHTVHGSSDTHEARAGFAAMGNAVRRRVHTPLRRHMAHGTRSTPATRTHTHARTA